MELYLQTKTVWILSKYRISKMTDTMIFSHRIVISFFQSRQVLLRMVTAQFHSLLHSVKCVEKKVTSPLLTTLLVLVESRNCHNYSIRRYLINLTSFFYVCVCACACVNVLLQRDAFIRSCSTNLVDKGIDSQIIFQVVPSFTVLF